MSKVKNITATYQEIRFAETYISGLNPRTIIDDETIAALAANIRQVGLIHPLAGLVDAEGRIGIVAGGRRHRALATLQDDPRFQVIPVHIAPDEETAQAWAASENNVREALHPADEIAEFGKMAARHIAIPAIAVAFGVTEAHVYRRLALSNLPDTVLTALKNNQISLGHAKSFTVAKDVTLIAETLETVIEATERGQVITEHWIKTRLQPDAVRSTDRRAVFVTVETYQNAGGAITADLFSDQTLLEDPALLDRLFEEKLSFVAQSYASQKGWAWAAVSPEAYLPWDYIQTHKLSRIYPVEGVLTEEEAQRYDELSELYEADVLDEDGQAELTALEDKQEGDFTPEQRALAGVILTIDREGDLTPNMAYVRPDDRAEAEEKGILAPNRHDTMTTADAPKSPISDALRQDLRKIETGARQNALLNDPKLALSLLAFQLSGKMGAQNAFGLRCDTVPNRPTTETGFTLDKRLEPRAIDYANHFGRDNAADFANFRKLGEAKIMDKLTECLAALLTVDDPKLGAMIDAMTKKRTRDAFTPNAENFFGRVAAPYLEALWVDLLDLPTDHQTVTEFAKLKKAEKAAQMERLFNDADTRAALGLTEAQCTRIAEWLPDDMA